MPRTLLLLVVSLVVAALGLPLAVGAATSEGVAHRFVRAANHGDYETVCQLYSRRYLKVSQRECRALYRWGESIYGHFDYRIVHSQKLHSGHWRVDLTRWEHASFIELAHEPSGWKIVAGGW